MPVVGLRGGKIATLRLEYNLTEHCNYACNQCSHLSPYMKRRVSSLESFRRDLAALTSIMQAHQFVFVGGEPLLNKEILPHIRAVRDSGIAKEIQISTNGSRIDTTPIEVFSEIDSLSISWYADARCDSEKIELARSICKSTNTRLDVKRITTFRSMEAGHIENKNLVDSIYKTCEIAHTYYSQTFHEGRFYLCSRPIFSQNYLHKVGIDAPDFRELDGIPLHSPHLKERLFAALTSAVPTAACSYCLGTVGRKTAWRSLSAAERRSPTLPSGAPLERINRRRLWLLRARRALSLNHHLLFGPLLLLIRTGLPVWRPLRALRKKTAVSSLGLWSSGLRPTLADEAETAGTIKPSTAATG
jgi:organic radical activating enzyme